MTTISFEATYDLLALHKMKIAELKVVWMKVCSPPALKEQLIREIMFFQKKNLSDVLKIQNIRKTDATSKSDVQARKSEASSDRGYLSRFDYERKLSDPPKRKSATTRIGASKSISRSKSRISESRNRTRKYASLSPEKKSEFSKLSSDESDNENIANKPALVGGHELRNPHSYSGGFMRWITGSGKIEKKSDQDIDHIALKNGKGSAQRKHRNQLAPVNKLQTLSKQRVKPRPFASVGKLNLEHGYRRNGDSLNVDIRLDGLDSIPDIELKNKVAREDSSVFKIKAPSGRVHMDNFENTTV